MYLLTTRELELGTSESLDDGGLVPVAGAHRHDGLSDMYASDSSLRFAESTSHSSLEPTMLTINKHASENDISDLHNEVMFNLNSPISPSAR